VFPLLNEEIKSILENQKGNQRNQFILQIANNLKERLAHEHFVGAKCINIAMMQYAMELIDEEDKEE
jgi:hypothetical protein